VYKIEYNGEEMERIRRVVKLVNFNKFSGLCWKVVSSDTNIFILLKIVTWSVFKPDTFLTQVRKIYDWLKLIKTRYCS